MKNARKLYLVCIIAMFLITISTADATKWQRGPNGELTAATESGQATAAQGQADSPQDAAVARTRRQIQMLDDLYKTAVVLITEHYVNDPSTLSAATASKALFAAMKEKGWHDARLLGFTDVLFNPVENAPKDDFEKAAKSELLGGAATYEEVANINGRDYLRMATTVPVVMEKCVMCHANFKGVEGAIGAISYTVPLVK
jgi:Protein of unknown function (DUF3365)